MSFTPSKPRPRSHWKKLTQLALSSFMPSAAPKNLTKAVLIQLYDFLGHSLLSPFECLCGNFILPEPASYVFFYAFSNLRNLLYIISGFTCRAASKSGGIPHRKNRALRLTAETLYFVFWDSPKPLYIRKPHCCNAPQLDSILDCTDIWCLF